MTKYLICNNGCDDTTYTEIELTDEELQTLIKIAKENNKNSSYECQPKIGIFKDYIIKGKRDFRIDEWDVEKREYKWQAENLVKEEDDI